MDVRRAPGMPTGRTQHPADRPVGRDRVVDRPHGANEIQALRVGVEFAAHVQSAQALVLRIVKTIRLRLPDIEQRAFDRVAVEIEHPAADQGRCPGLVKSGDVATRRQLGRAEPVERAKHRRLGGTIRFAVADQVDDHRDPERVREQDEFLPLVAAHPTGFGQDLDRLEPLRLGQLDFLDEGVQVLDETQHDLPQPRIRRLRKSLQHLGGNVVFGLVPLHLHAIPHVRSTWRLKRRRRLSGRSGCRGRCRHPIRGRPRSCRYCPG